MLVQFSVKNYKVFKDKATISMLASNYDKESREEDNIFINNNYKFRILKSAIMYGANASGKSKFIDAINFARNFVINSFKASQIGDKIEVDPFRLSTDTEKEPSEFEFVFIYNEILFRYGFEANNIKIISEWLYFKPKTKEIELFYRDRKNIDIHSRNFNKGKSIVKGNWLRENSLLISIAAQFNDSLAVSVIEWFQNLKLLSGLHEFGYSGFTISKTEDKIAKDKMMDLIKAADIGIYDINLLKLDLENLPRDMPKEIKEKIIEEKVELFSDVITSHKKYDASKKNIGSVEFSLEDDESSGTQKFFYLTGPILDVLENGIILVVDELDSKLHPNLVCKLVALFNSKELNPKNAQLIFNTHDTNLLGSGLFRRDQIWFTDKNKYGESKLYSLADFKSDNVKKTENYEEFYIKGKYGAVPNLGSFDFLNNQSF